MSDEALEYVTCGKCGIRFAAPSWWCEARRHDHADWYCPNGHLRRFVGKTEVDRLREEVERLKQVREREESRANANLDRWFAEQRRVTALRGHLTRARKKREAVVEKLLSFKRNRGRPR